ncbi:uracil-DNA glycosylase-like protein [Limtongia smithiae]|uniref:uracil-DNA glycosylase-like protein n=1 Tax=Limtongia smithiae TaxID=1125753 RepID=UPI0034CF7170
MSKQLSFNGLLDKYVHSDLGDADIVQTSTSSPVKTARTGADASAGSPSSTPNSTPQASPATTPTKKKRKRTRGYAPPARYAHLSGVADTLLPNLICVFVGLNPGIMTSQTGCVFANPTNLFLPLLFESGCVPRKLSYLDSKALPRKYRLGVTNLVARPTAEQSELSRQEMIAGVPELEAKLCEYAPQLVCIVGKGIWESIYRHKTGRPLKADAFAFGWQDQTACRFPEVETGSAIVPTRVFVVPSTSGRVAAYSRAMKAELWGVLGREVQLIRAAEA